MSQRLRSYVRQNHLALLALMIAVVGVPTAWAVSRNTVGSAQIKKNVVKHQDLADNAVKSPEVAAGSLLSSDFAAGQLPRGEQGPPGPSALRLDFDRPKPTNTLRTVGTQTS